MIKISPVTLELGNHHVHTWRSDGELTELEIILLALTQKLKRIELTDHDTVLAWSPGVIDTINEYLSGGVELKSNGTINPENPELIRPQYVRYIFEQCDLDDYHLHAYHHIEDDQPGVLRCTPDLKIGKGIELTARMGKTFHILGLTLTNISPEFQQKLEEICDIRRKRAKEIIDHLYAKDLFFERTLDFLKSGGKADFSRGQLTDLIGDTPAVTYEDVLRINPNAPSRLTVGFLLWQRYGKELYGDFTPEQVRDIYLKRSPESKFNIPTFSPKEAIRQILINGGVPAYAHPNEGRRPDDTWLDGDFRTFEAEGVSVKGLLKKGIIDQSDIDYAALHSMMALFVLWGIRAVEDVYYSRTHGLLDLSEDTDWHGPEMKKERQITGGPVPSLETILTLKAVKEAHNTLYWKMKSAPEYERWQQTYSRTEELISAFPDKEKTDEQEKILASMPCELEKVYSLEEYLNMTKIHEVNPNFRGTVLELETSVKNTLTRMNRSGSYLHQSDREYDAKIDSYLKRKIGKYTVGEILLENLPFLHNIGKVLTFGIKEKEQEEDEGYYTTFIQHDDVGAEFIESIRPVLAQDLGLSNNEIDYIRDVTLYHVKVHEATYKIQERLITSDQTGGVQELTADIIQRKELNPELILSSLLLIRAAGKFCYVGNQDQYNQYTAAIDTLMKISVDKLES